MNPQYAPHVLHVHTDLVGGGIERMMVTLAAHTQADEVGICWCPANHPEPPEATLQELANEGVMLHKIPPPFLSPIYLFRLARLLRQVRPDVLHLHGATIGVAGSLIGRMMRVPAIVYTEHLQHDRHARWLRRAREWTARLPHRTVFVSEKSFQQAIENGPLKRIADRASVIHNGIDLAPYAQKATDAAREALRRELELTPNNITIGCVGLLWEAKGQEYLLRALAEVKQLDAIVLLVGSGAEQEVLRDYAEEMGLAERVFFLGWRNDVPQILQLLDIYVQPSLTEGLPLAVVEAAAAGLPIVASEVGGIPEIITHGQDGLLVPPGNPEALAEAIAELIENPEEARRLGENARKTAFDRFSAEAMASKYMDLYTELLAQNQAVS